MRSSCFLARGFARAVVALHLAYDRQTQIAVLQARLLAEHIKQYQFENAAAHTDFRRAQALAADEPSLLWLAIDVLATVTDWAVAVKSFRTLQAIARTGNALASDAAIQKLVTQVDSLDLGSAEKLALT